MSDNLFTKYGVSLKANDVLFKAGDVGEEMYVIRSGSVRVVIRTPGGIEKTLAVLGPGEFVGEMSVLTNQARSATAVIEEDAELLVVGVKVLEEMIVHNTEIALRLVRKLASRLVAADSLIQVLLHRDAKARIIENLKRLARLHAREGQTGARFRADFDGMAEQVGISREEAEDIIMKLVAAGFITQDGGDWVIANIDDIDDFLNFLRLKEQYR
ncbi:MAG: Crp/Fnr family transcriptional regulator [Deltaproteobacteria bacterium]|nr:Crp/Fnr family transcriptional regulator [Deltaproteobacteria bacterium]MBN2672168.1 Crp/Fnr family transcriptional regulator [Deltaproteobacteria bacterium]